ncbi:MAG: ABC transporter permease [Dehalococcoidia bacterium]
MQKYIVRRLLLSIPTLLGITIVVFVMVRAVPGDVVALIAGDFGSVPEETKQAMLKEFGLDDNVPVQYVKWFGRIVRLDLGTSIISGRTVTSELSRRIPISFELAILGQLLSIGMAVPIGIISAIRQNSAADYVGRSVAIGFLAAPNFWLGLILIVAAARYFQWGVPPPSYVSFTDNPIGNLKLLFVPAIILGTGGSGNLMRYMRTTMLEVMRQDYVRTAWAKGLTERTVILRHALRNALIPIVTLVGLGLPGLIGGTVLIEAIYSIPGMGRYYIQALNSLDFPVVQGVNLVIGLTVVLSNLLVDLSYPLLDPRIRYT